MSWISSQRCPSAGPVWSPSTATKASSSMRISSRRGHVQQPHQRGSTRATGPSPTPASSAGTGEPNSPPDKWCKHHRDGRFLPGRYGYKLITKLRFIKSNQVPDRTPDLTSISPRIKRLDRKVKVDKGFVNARVPTPTGHLEGRRSAARRRKVAHVTGISPYAQAFMLCKLGYGWAAAHAPSSVPAMAAAALRLRRMEGGTAQNGRSRIRPPIRGRRTDEQYQPNVRHPGDTTDRGHLETSQARRSQRRRQSR